MKKKFPQLTGNSYLIDTHCHLDMDYYGDDLPEVLDRAIKNNVKKVITIGIDLKSSKAAIKLAKQYSFIHPTIGIHPHDVANITESTYQDLRQLYTENKETVIGYGEIGLDYAKMYAPKDLQLEHFSKQLILAEELQLPVIIHCRDAQEDLLNILKQYAPFKQLGVIHCFSGDMSFAKAVLSLGFYISIPGIVSFKNAQELHQVALETPMDRMLVETDGPFLAPAPYRGKRNEPAYLLYTAQHIADIRNITIDEVARYTTKNAELLFNI